MKRLFLAGILAANLCGCLSGQTPPSTPVFEVADLKLNVSGPGPQSVVLADGRVIIRNVALRPLIAAAWTLPVAAVKGPDWLDDVRVDLVAKPESPQTPEADLRVMMRAVFRDRMKMVARIEERRESVWALSIWKGQPKMRAAEMPAKAEDAKCGPGDSTAGIRMVCTRETMTSFARILSQIGGWEPAGKRVVDQTGLAGAWDFSIEWTPPRQSGEGGLDLFAALQAQLGLRLESKEIPVPVLVIESMDRTPTDN
jgi:uncharacterized protein (TIGR03435 family)